MQITGLVMDARSKAPIAAARVLITNEGGGAEIASPATDEKGRFTFDDDLNEYLGQELAFTASHRSYKEHRVVQRAERGVTVVIPMEPLNGGPPLGLLAKIGVAVVVLGLLAWLLAPYLGRREPQLACDFATIRNAAGAGDTALLWRIAGVCERQPNLELRFAAINECAQHGHGPCLMTMARWYDPALAAEPTPFQQRRAALATQYYQRALGQGVEEARAPLEALCGALRQQGGQELLEARC